MVCHFLRQAKKGENFRLKKFTNTISIRGTKTQTELPFTLPVTAYHIVLYKIKESKKSSN
jgi:hypothetical protein